MKRRLRTLLVFLILGAIINVAVAWGCVASVGSHLINAPSRPRKVLRLIDSPYDALDGSGMTVIRVGVRIVHDFEKGESAFTVNEHIEAGWPKLSVSGRSEQSVDFKATIPQQSFAASLAIPLRTPPPATIQLGPSVLPLMPILPGFAINTLFYAALLWIIFVFPFTLRRRLRIRRGICPACAYPAGPSPICTECGYVSTAHFRR